MKIAPLHFCLVVGSAAFSSGTASSDASKIAKETTGTILRIEMHLSAVGVEADCFPSIDVTIDFIRHSSKSTKSYFDPACNGSVYRLSNGEIDSVAMLLRKADFRKLKDKYRIPRTDQPTSTLVVYTSEGKRTIEDYGLQGEYPLPELYKLVYKF